MKRFVLFVSLCLSMALSASDWAPIPGKVWAMKPAPEGAIVLEQRWRFNRLSIEYVYRVRIFSEAGRKAAHLPDIPSNSFGIEGRTTYPDGREVVFNSRKDFSEITAKQAWKRDSVTSVIPPGVTSDCVVEVKWSERADGPVACLPYRFSRGLYKKWMLGGPYPVESTVIEVVRPFGLALRVVPEAYPPPERSEAWGVLTLRLGPLPAMEAAPFALPPLLGRPYLEVYAQPDNLDMTRGPKHYWETVVQTMIKGNYEGGIKTGKAYERLVSALTARLPSGPIAAARELMTRLEARIINASEPTFQEAALLPKDCLQGLESHDLETAARRGWTDAEGMRLLFFHLLKAAGITPRLAMVPDRQVHLFAWADLNLFQFSRELLGVEDPAEGVAWFDPTLRLARPGVVLPDDTAVPALIIDTRTWDPAPGVVRGLGPSENQTRYVFHLVLEPEADRFNLQASFAGYPDYLARQAFLRLDSPDQAKALREQLESGHREVSILKTEVQQAVDPRAGVTWVASGIREPSGGRSRVVDPFPCMPRPLAIPSQLGPTRTTPIVLPYPLIQTAESAFELPEGYQVAPVSDWDKGNRIGRVSRALRYDPIARQMRVTLRIEIHSTYFGPDQWQAFKEFLTWIDDACETRVVLTRAAP